MRRLVIALALLPLVAVPAGAEAQTKTKTVPATVVVNHGQRPTDPGNCSAIAFAQWKHVPNVQSATVRYAYKTSGDPRQESETRSGPAFDNHFEFVATYDVPAGSDWIAFAKNWRDGPGVDTCEGLAGKLDAIIVRPVTVELTIKIDPVACSAARKQHSRKQKAVAKLQGRVTGAKGREKARLKKALKAAKKSRDAATAKVAELC